MLLVALGSGGGGPTTPSATAGGPAASAYGKLPLRFEANRGQTDARVDFLARGAGYSLFLTRRGSVLSLAGAAPTRSPSPSGSRSPSGAAPARSPSSSRASSPAGAARGPSGQARPAVLRMRLAGASPRPEPAGLDRLAGTTNYLRGGAPARSQAGVPGFAKVRYRGVYPGVDVLYHGRRGRFEYDFELAPRADPGRIGLDFSGHRRLAVTARGDLVLGTAAGAVRHRRPVAYQRVAGGRRAVRARFALRRGGRVGFRLGAYDRSRPLTIDPVVVYSTYLGGLTGDSGSAVAADGSGATYVTGVTGSPDFPTKAPIRGGPNLAGDAFVTKLDPSGALVYSTYLGGTSGDTGTGIAVDAAGAAYLTGQTSSTDFPTTSGAFDSTCGGSIGCSSGDAFLAKLLPSGAGLVYSTYLGGDRADSASDVALDGSGAAYIGGSTASTDFPTQAAYQATYGGGERDGFVTKVNASGSGLAYSTYLGGSGQRPEAVSGIDVDSAGSAYATGTTVSPNFPTTPGAFDGSCGTEGTCNGGDPALNSDAFVSKLSPTGAALDYSTFLGSAGRDEGGAIAVGRVGPDAGRAYVLGTAAPDLPTTAGAFDRTSGGAFVARLNANGSGLGYSTFLGGPKVRGGDVGVDPSGSAHVVGSTGGEAGPPPLMAVAESGNDPNQAFVTKLRADGSGLAWSTFLGGNSGSAGSGLALDPAGAAHVTGSTNATDFPTQNPVQRRRAGTVADGFVAKLAPEDPAAPYVIGVTPQGDDAAGGRAVRITGTGFSGTSAVAFGDVAAARFEVVSPTEIEAIAPPHAEGEPRVTVTSGGRTSPPNPIARFVYAEGRWSSTAPLPSARTGTATLLTDGRVLFVSGTTAALYDPKAGSWGPTAGPALAGGGTPVLLRTGKVLVVHPGDSFLSLLAKAELYDPVTGAWAPTRGGPKAFGGRAVLLPNDKVLIVGGETAELYDPATDSFRVTGGPSFPTPAAATLTPLRDGRALLAGGDEFGRQNIAEIYDPATGAFSRTGRLNIGRHDFTATLLPSGKVLVVGGFSIRAGGLQDTAEVYDPATGRWTLTRQLDGGRAGHSATLLPNGKVLVAGGAAFGPVDTAELYDPALGGGNGGFRSAGRMEAFRGAPTATVLSSDPTRFASDPAACGADCGKVLVAGSAATAAADLYTPRPPVPPSPVPGGASPPPAPPASLSPAPPPAPFPGCRAPAAAVVRGTAGRDSLTGTSRAERMFALAGDDRVNALGGGDCLDLGPGADRGAGGAGADLVLGGIGDDLLLGGAGDDLLLGGAGADRLDGGAGGDRLSGGAGADRLDGGAGGDRLSGGAAADHLDGGAGNDRLDGGSGGDRLTGGAGADRIDPRDGGRDRISCGRGRDTVLADRADRVARDCERVRRPAGRRARRGAGGNR